MATKEAAEDVVQETWLGVIRGIDGFESRASLNTWIFRILVNRAKTRGEPRIADQAVLIAGSRGG